VIRICRASHLTENKTVKFVIPQEKFDREGFALCKDGKFFAYYNECAHINLPLDWNDNDFFALDFESVVCKNHGAQFRLDDGVCTIGPCTGAALKAIPITIAMIDNEEWLVAQLD
jgi:nitrite reductase/ring-hydroxylating ferredoxin subunit